MRQLTACTQAPDTAAALSIVQKNNCLSCHAVDSQVVGPAYREIAKKYHGDATRPTNSSPKSAMAERSFGVKSPWMIISRESEIKLVGVTSVVKARASSSRINPAHRTRKAPLKVTAIATKR